MFDKFDVENGTEKNVWVAIIAGILALILGGLSILLGLPLEYVAVFLWVLAAFQATKGKHSTASAISKKVSYCLVLLNIPVIVFMAGRIFLSALKIKG